jgi:hypothetical protein
LTKAPLNSKLASIHDYLKVIMEDPRVFVKARVLSGQRCAEAEAARLVRDLLSKVTIGLV